MSNQQHDNMLGLRVEGYREGFSDATLSVLDWLEATYLSPKLEDPKSPKGEAVLQVAGDLAAAMRKPDFGKGRKKN